MQYKDISFYQTKLHIISLLIPLFLSLSIYARKIIIATEESGRLTELGLPIVKCSMNKLNLNFKIIRVPWVRAQEKTRTGSYDGFFMASKTESRDKYAVQSDVFYSSSWVFVTKKGSGIKKVSKGFYDKSFVSNFGSARYTWLLNKHKKGEIKQNIIDVNEPVQVLRMLRTKRVDIGLLNKHNFNDSLLKLNMEKDKFNVFIAKEKRLGVYFSYRLLNEMPYFLKLFNESLSACK